MTLFIKKLLMISIFLLIANTFVNAKEDNKKKIKTNTFSSTIAKNINSKSIASFVKEIKKYAPVIIIVVLSFVFLTALLSLKIDEKENNTSTKFKWFKTYELNTSKAAYIREVLKWCAKNMNDKKVKTLPHLEISYYKHKKNAGVYYSQNKLIRINVNNHNNVLALTDTIIHEYQHHLDMPSQKHQKEYNELIAAIGYWNNPYEIKARESAKKHREICAKEMCSRGFLLYK
jgi:predicted SprT family Zn-dependent metalloprotease